MKKAAHVITLEKLEGAGWTVDHEALTRSYHLAGSVAPMKSRNGVDYCRVFVGKCVSHRNYQLSYVMKRLQQVEA